MPEAPYITGTDITSNQGNAALGYSGTGIEYNANPANTNPFEVTQNALGKLQDFEAQMNVGRYNQRLKEREETARFLASTGQSAFNMTDETGKNNSFNLLPEDRDEINNAATEIRRLVVSNPDTYKFDPSVREKMDKFNQLKNHASIRAIELAKEQQLAAQTNDPEERQQILDNIQNQIRSKKVSEFHAPEPHLPKQRWEGEKLISSDIITGKDKNAYNTYRVTAGKDDQGNEIHVTKEGIGDNALDFRGKANAGSSIFPHVQNMVSSFYNSPYSKDPNTILDMNANIDEINQERGYAKSSPHYIPHVAEVLPNGEIQYNRIAPQDVAYAIMAERYGKLQNSQEIKKSAADIKKGEAETAQGWARIRQADENLKLEKQKLDNEKDKMTKADYDNEKDKIESQSVALSIYKHLNSIKGNTEIKDLIASVPGGEKSGVNKTIKENGINQDDYKISLLNNDDQTIKQISGIQFQKPDGAYANGVGKPTYAYMLKAKDGNIANDMYLVGYKELEPKKNDDGTIIIGSNNKPAMQEVMKWKTISPQEAIGNVIKSRKNFYNITDKTGGVIDRGINAFNELLGGGAQESPAPQQNQTATTPGTVQATKTIGGKTYVQIDGQWYEQG